LGEDSTAPYEYVWSGMDPGKYTLTAKATDDGGAETTSTAVGIVINPPDTDPPTVSITSPLDGATLEAPADIIIGATAADSDGTVTKVEFYNGTKKIGEATTAPYTFTWTNVPMGTYYLIATAIDNLGAKGTSAQVKVVVSSDNAYLDHFLELYQDLHTKGYLSQEGVPYHCIETMIIEGPDYGHLTTSEAFSFYIWLEAMYGRITQDWTKLQTAWEIMEKYIIPSHQDQPTNDFQKVNSPSTYAPEYLLPDYYPTTMDSSAPVGPDPLFTELKTTYGTSDIYGMHWLLDVDNWYGYGNRGDGTSRCSYINNYQRGPQESTWETVPHPSWEVFKWGGPNGFLDLFLKGGTYAPQWRYTNAPDADARAIQALYWAKMWADEQGGSAIVDALVPKAAKMGDYLRYSFFDKHFKPIGCTDPKASVGTNPYDSCHYLMSWYYSWGGAVDATAGWAFRIGCSYSHFGYQNPLAAYVLGNLTDFAPLSPNAVRDWKASLQRQVEFYRWLQTADGAIAGGCTNSWEGAYKVPPVGTTTFYKMAYDVSPSYLDPPSNRWFGMQAWSMERMAEYLYVSKDTNAKVILDKWVKWVKASVKLYADGNYEIPCDLTWSGQPGTNWDATHQNWDPADTAFNSNLRVSITNYTQDTGVTAALAKALIYYAKATGDNEARVLAKELLDRMWALFRDDKGVSCPEPRSDYNRIFDQTVYIPSGWSGEMANGDPIKPGVKFIDIRSKYREDPDWHIVEEAYNNKSAPVFHYHRFWGNADIALAYATYGLMFP
ncbi:MAG TPA: glycoside hydrolase family 48 protein, partial [Bacillota bacterium]|nr:glycoside hydrolase family 48 protein [Bacillota bacterium]